MDKIDPNLILNIIAVGALAVFLCLLPFHPVPAVNHDLALAISGALGGFIGGVATAKAVTKLGGANGPSA